MTETPTPATQIPPDPDLYDSPRAELARARGLDAPYIAGGEDPEPEAALEVDRKYGRLLLFMVVTIVLAGFVIGVAIALADGRACDADRPADAALHRLGRARRTRWSRRCAT